jgi:hypothetical protein
MTDRATAIHEAAHAVIALALGVAVDYATVIADDDDVGHVLTGQARSEQPGDAVATFDGLVADAIISLAGPLAELHDNPSASDAEAWRGDIADIIERIVTALDLLGGDADPAELIEGLHDQAARLVDENWHQIERLAEALQRDGFLTGDQITAALARD